jgi:hypothetical protein
MEISYSFFPQWMRTRKYALQDQDVSALGKILEEIKERAFFFERLNEKLNSAVLFEFLGDVSCLYQFPDFSKFHNKSASLYFECAREQEKISIKNAAFLWEKQSSVFKKSVIPPNEWQTNAMLDGCAKSGIMYRDLYAESILQKSAASVQMLEK